jgi:hypothetical protein
LVGVRGFEPPAPASGSSALRRYVIGDDLGRIERPPGVDQKHRTGGSGIIAHSAFVISSLATRTFSAMSRPWCSRNVGESFIARIVAPPMIQLCRARVAVCPAAFCTSSRCAPFSSAMVIRVARIECAEVAAIEAKLDADDGSGRLLCRSSNGRLFWHQVKSAMPSLSGIGRWPESRPMTWNTLPRATSRLRSWATHSTCCSIDGSMLVSIEGLPGPVIVKRLRNRLGRGQDLGLRPPFAPFLLERLAAGAADVDVQPRPDPRCGRGRRIPQRRPCPTGGRRRKNIESTAASRPPYAERP